jgi:hypothetical protein
MSIHKRTTTDGTTVYDVRLRDPYGRQYKRTFRTKHQARDFEAQEHSDRARGIWLDVRHGRTVFREWAEQWLDTDRAKRPKSRLSDHQTIARH